MTQKLIISMLMLSQPSLANEPFLWPNNAKAAVSLSYDDALNSQLDHALPVLNKASLKATFYLSLNSPTISKRLNDWRSAATQGHELGNHSIYHACSGSLKGREWVAKHNDLDNKFFDAIIDEIHTANSFLHAIDGLSQRTFTVPCGDQIVENRNYVNTLKDTFIGMKSHMGNIPASMKAFDRLNAPVWSPDGATGLELISYVEQAASNGTIANITFHGIGGDYLSVSTNAHQMLIDHLVENKDHYWVDTYLNISTYLSKID